MRHESEAYTPLERDAMAYAEAMRLTPPMDGDELVERLRTTLGEAPLVELTAVVAVQNMRSRTNFRFRSDRPELQGPMRGGAPRRPPTDAVRPLNDDSAVAALTGLPAPPDTDRRFSKSTR
ncbi:hypothetical protein [Streptomyces atratus]